MPDEIDERTILRLVWRVDDLDKWRETVDGRLGWLTRELERLVKADEIADAVASKMNEREGWHLSVIQRRLAIATVLVTALGVLVEAGVGLAHLAGG